MNRIHTRPHQWRVITVFNLLVGLLFSQSVLGQPAFLKDGLVAYYPFNGNANDESGNEKPLTGIASFGTRENVSEFNKCVSFERSRDVLQFSFSDSDLFNKNNTVSQWVYFNNDTPDYQGVFTVLSRENPNPQFWSYSISRLGKPYKADTNLLVVAPRYWNIAGKFTDLLATPSTRGVYIQQSNWVYLTAARSNTTFAIYTNGILALRQTYSDPLNLLKISSKSVGYVGGFLTNDSNEILNGKIDELRIYNRALSDTEVKALYDYESTPPQTNTNPRIASATAQVVNGFVVGATITDAGYGYVSNPAVTITGGGGSGAKATATQFNGVVTSITITNPGSGYNSAPTITIAPPPFPPRKATGTTQIVNGFVVGTKITDGGFGYDTPPAVLIVGGGGSGATAVATVANGVVTAITITNPGTGYTSIPIVRIASPPFAPKLAIETSKVYVRMSVVLGRKYQLEASTDLNTWTSTGPSFIAQDEELVQEFDVNQVGRYFRINQVP